MCLTHMFLEWESRHLRISDRVLGRPRIAINIPLVKFYTGCYICESQMPCHVFVGGVYPFIANGDLKLIGVCIATPVMCVSKELHPLIITVTVFSKL